jgi:glycerol-3-phosphate O-acyltransferase/dihydroxyacetone phosphate acyltransferase
MWMTLRWFEDGVSALRALISLFRLLTLPKDKLNETRRWRARLERGVNRMAVRRLGLPADPVKAFSVKGDSVDWKKEKGWVSGSWGRGIGYFSITRRRKRDWNETLRWYNYDENLP